MPGLRSILLVAGLALAVGVAGCETGGEATASAASAQAPATAVASATSAPSAVASADPCDGPGPRACDKPYVAPDENAPAAKEKEEAKADAGTDAGADDEADAGAKRQLGTLEDWVREYAGMATPDTHQPPKLGGLGDLPKLPRTTLVYVRSAQLVRVDLPSGVETQLTRGKFASRQPRWTRDGKHIFFLSNRDKAIEKVFRMEPDGTNVVAVTKGLSSKDLEWDVSDDGTKIAYVRGGGEDDRHELHVVDVAARSDDVVYRGPSVRYPSLSRDAKRLFFVEGFFEAPGPGATQPKKLGVVDLVTRDVKKLPNGGYAEITSPWDLGDGRLLFVASQDFSMMGRLPQMYTMPLDGGAWTRLSEFGTPIGYFHPTPSHDRRKLAVEWSARQGGFGADWHEDVGIMKPGDASARALTSKFPRPFYGASSASWAHDNRHVAFTLSLCPYIGCEPHLRSVVIVDTEAAEPKLAFVGWGGAPELSPAAPEN